MTTSDHPDPDGTAGILARGRSIGLSPKWLQTVALLLIVLSATPLAIWWGKGFRVAQAELELVRVLSSAHLGRVYYDYEEFEYGYDSSQPPFPRPWYHRVLPDDARPRVVDVSLQSTISPEVRSQLIERSSRLPHLRRLSFGTMHGFFNCESPEADARAEDWFYRNKIPLTARDFEAIGRMSNLRILDLTGTSTDDAGLPHLERLPHLETLWLRGTNVTAEGICRLQAALPQVEIYCRYASE